MPSKYGAMQRATCGQPAVFLYFVVLVCSSVLISKAGASVRVAVIGDHGVGSTQAHAVAQMVHSWKPDAIVSLGDTNYPSGSASTLDANVGKFYSQYMHPYNGTYGHGAPGKRNKFWPCPGNHDYNKEAGLQPYLSYMPVEGKRFYDVRLGPVHLFSLDSCRDSGGEGGRTDSNSHQANWLRARLAVSAAPWNLIAFHHPPYSSGSHGGSQRMRWDFGALGATAVLSGHDHSFERIVLPSTGPSAAAAGGFGGASTEGSAPEGASSGAGADPASSASSGPSSGAGLPYFVNGMGGATSYGFKNSPVEGSAFRHTGAPGAQLIEADAHRITFKFYAAAEGGPELKDCYQAVMQADGSKRYSVCGADDADADAAGEDAAEGAAGGETAGASSSSSVAPEGQGESYGDGGVQPGSNGRLHSGQAPASDRGTSGSGSPGGTAADGQGKGAEAKGHVHSARVHGGGAGAFAGRVGTGRTKLNARRGKAKAAVAAGGAGRGAGRVGAAGAGAAAGVTTPAAAAGAAAVAKQDGVAVLGIGAGSSATGNSSTNSSSTNRSSTNSGSSSSECLRAHKRCGAGAQGECCAPHICLKNGRCGIAPRAHVKGGRFALRRRMASKQGAGSD